MKKDLVFHCIFDKGLAKHDIMERMRHWKNHNVAAKILKTLEKKGVREVHLAVYLSKRQTVYDISKLSIVRERRINVERRDV